VSKRQNDPEVARAMAVAGQLRVAIGKLKRRLRAEMHLKDFTWPQVEVLGRLERDGPTTVTNLAKAEGVRPQSMGETLSALKTAGLVSGAPDPNDGRQTVLSLTPACVELIRATRAAREDWLFHTIRTQFTSTEQEDLARAVELLTRLAES
jgi:DNA-binding MarR family transcriptional regulator